MKEKVNQEQRAFSAWRILTNCAKNKETITYGALAQQMGLHHRAIRFVLGPIQSYCLENKLPPLTILVLNQTTKIPGEGFIAWDVENAEDGLRKVYDFSWSAIDNPFLYAATGSTENQLIEQIIQHPENSEETYAIVQVRGIAQKIFRQALLKVYSRKCAICGLSFEEALEASHIIPYARSDNKQRLDVRNGLLLCSLHHKLFDSRWITINQDYSVEYHDSKQELGHDSEYDKLMTINLHGNKISLPKEIQHFPSLDYLAIHQKLNE